jgi:uroporphyrinogen decarboxylase
MPQGRVGRFLDACRCQPVDTTPVWFMRQAGRSLPEYRALRGDGDILDAIADPELAAEVTLQPVRRYGVDAAILFSDIVVPLAAIGVGVEIVPGRGPVVDEPFRSARDLARLRPFDAAADAPYVAETVRILTKELAVPLIGFAGMPFTLASYLVEGGPSKTFAGVKALMHAEPVLFGGLLEALAEITVGFVTAQVEAGADAVQLFDSWAGALSRADYERYVMPASLALLGALSGLGVPRIHFGVGTGELLDLMAGPDVDVVGVDWRVPLDSAAERIGAGKALQGNLDPAICLAPWEVVRAEVERVMDEASGLAGHIFNLGHGVLPETDPAILERIVETVHELGAR